MSVRLLAPMMRAIDRFAEFCGVVIAMSAYYLEQVAKGWSLLTIYKGMFQLMGIQVVAIALIFAFPAIATWLPEPPISFSETYGGSYEQMYQRSVEGLEQQKQQ